MDDTAAHSPRDVVVVDACCTYTCTSTYIVFVLRINYAVLAVCTSYKFMQQTTFAYIMRRYTSEAQQQ